MAIVGLQPANYTLHVIHPWAAPFGECPGIHGMFPDSFPFSVVTRFFSGIISMQSLLQDVILADNAIKSITSIGLLMHGHDN